MVRFIINRFEPIDDRIGIFALIHVDGRFNAIVNIVKNNFADFSQLTLCRINETKFGVVLKVFANVYETSPENYRKTLTDNISKSYKLSGNECVTDTINQELKDITNSLSIGNRIDIMAKKMLM